MPPPLMPGLQVTWLACIDDDGAMCVSEGFRWDDEDVTVLQVRGRALAVWH